MNHFSHEFFEWPKGGNFTCRVLMDIMGGLGPSLLGSGAPNYAGADRVGDLGEWVAYPIIKY